MRKQIEKAINFAKEKHKNQTRRFSDIPYFIHPSRVANILKNYTNEEELIIAAYLHDTIEDTDTTSAEIEEQFNQRIAYLVNELTSDNKAIQKMGKAKYLTAKMSKMSDDALLIKLCDRLDNLTDLGNASKKFIKNYKNQTRYILDNIKRKNDFSSSQIELINRILKLL